MLTGRSGTNSALIMGTRLALAAGTSVPTRQPVPSGFTAPLCVGICEVDWLRLQRERRNVHSRRAIGMRPASRLWIANALARGISFAAYGNEPPKTKSGAHPIKTPFPIFRRSFGADRHVAEPPYPGVPAHCPSTHQPVVTRHRAGGETQSHESARRRQRICFPDERQAPARPTPEHASLFRS